MTSSTSARKTNRCLDLLLIGLIVCGFMCVAEFGPKNATLSNWLQPDFRNHLGAEYNEIAQAIRGGRGFSDPFGEPTGPTAWMPPVLPYLLSVLYWVARDHEPTVVLLVMAIQGLGVLLTGFLVVSHARQLHHTLFGYLVFTLGCVANFFHLFQRTDDIGLLAPVDFLDRVFNRWCAACVYYHAYRPNDERMLWSMRFKRVVFTLPFLSILAIIALYNGPMEPPVAAALWLYSLILLPYVLISYYDRYAAPLIGLKMLLVVYGFDSVLNWNRSRKRSR